MVLIDTDVLIWYMRGNPKAQAIIDQQGNFFISVVTYIELVQGMRNKKELAALRAALRQWDAKILYINEEISVKAMFFVEHYYLSSSLHLADALLAATTATYGVKLLTANTKHYSMIKEIEPIQFTP
ncbi:MAG: PIN domain-containing protein [Bacteroidota bacterium]|nr:PIN domain-containing protein [Bacteroidota bacterium]